MAGRRAPRAVLWHQVQARLRAEGRLAAADEPKLAALAAGRTWLDSLPAEFRNQHAAAYSESPQRTNESTRRIERDVRRTFSIFGLSLARDKRHKTRQLMRVLNTTCTGHNGAPTYCQGMNFVTAVLLLQLNEQDSFCVLQYLLHQRCLVGLYSERTPSLPLYVEAFEALLRREEPELAEHLAALEVSSFVFAVEWFTTLFAVSLDRQLTYCMFDLFLAGVDDVLLRAAVGILRHLRADLLRMGQDELFSAFKQMVRSIAPLDLLCAALAVHVPSGSNALARVAAAVEAGAKAEAEAEQETETAQTEQTGRTETETPAGLEPWAETHGSTLPFEMQRAVEAGDAQTLRELWAEAERSGQADPGFPDELLFQAAFFGAAAVAVFALERASAAVNARDLHMLTPLHVCVLRNQPGMARLLLLRGADPALAGGAAYFGDRALTPAEAAADADAWPRECEAAAYVLGGRVCLHCDALFPMLGGSAEPCARCGHRLCAPACVAEHRCPAVVGGWDSSSSDDEEGAAVPEDVSPPPSPPPPPPPPLSSLGEFLSSPSSWLGSPSSEDPEPEQPEQEPWHCHDDACRVVFGLLTHRYYCAVCGAAFCADHAPLRFGASAFSSSILPERVCWGCVPTAMASPG